jgi:hypothetical protein
MTKIIEVIETYVNKGKGTEESVIRQVYQLWTKDGKLIFENDPCPEENNQSQETKTLKTLETESKNIQMKSSRMDDVVEDRRLLTDKCLDTHSTKQELNKEILNDYSKTHCTCSDYNPKCDYCKKKDAISVKEVKV